MRKSPDAFRTISEVAQELDLPQHVLRFWETRFSQIKPMKRGGGRRYYRPDDVELLRGIRHLLYGEGYTIKGVQRILKEQGIRHVIEAFPGHVPQAEEVSEQGAENVPVPASPEEGLQDTQSVAPLNAEQSEGALPPVQSSVQPTPLPEGNDSQLSVPHPAAAQVAVQPAEPPQSVQRAPVQANPAPQVVAPAAPASVQSAVPSTQPVSPAAIAPEMNTTAKQEAPVASATPSIPSQPPHGAAPMPLDALAARPETPQTPAAAPPVPAQPITAPMGAAPNVATTSPAATPVPTMPAQPVQPPVAEPQAAPLPLAPNIMMPHATQPTPMPQDLAQGEPVYRQGQEAAVSVEAAQNSLMQENKTGFFSRLRGKTNAPDLADLSVQTSEQGMPRDDVRRLQSTLFELLECKRILDQARSSS